MLGVRNGNIWLILKRNCVGVVTEMGKFDLCGAETWAIVSELKRKHWRKMKQEERLAKASFNNKVEHNISGQE